MKSLRGKIIAGFITISIVSVIIAASLSYYEIYQVSTYYMRNDGIKLADQIKNDIELNGVDDTESVQSYIESAKQMNVQIKFIAFINLDNKVLANTEKNNIGTIFKDNYVKKVSTSGISESHMFKDNIAGSVYNVLIPLTDGKKIINIVSVGMSLDDMNKKIFSALINILLASLLIIILAIIISSIISSNIVKPLNKFINDFQVLSNGDLRVYFTVNTKDEILKLSQVMNKTMENFRNMIIQVKEDVVNIEKTSYMLSEASDSYAITSHESLNTVGKVSDQITAQGIDIINIEEMTNAFGNNLDIIYNKLDSVAKNSESIKVSADTGATNITNLTKSLKTTQESFDNVINKVEHLVKSVDSINQITNVINNVARQTNLLALNASIEAARAGEAGKGFAVVADEIRKLANEVLLSSASIEKLIHNVKLETIDVTDTSKLVSNDMNTQRNIVSETVESFNWIVNQVKEIVPHIKEVEVTLEESVTEKNQLLNKIEIISNATKDVSQSTAEISVTIENQSQSTNELKDLSKNLDKMSDLLIVSIEKFSV
jgi:methyl-accepting chemotaxis protein